MTEQDESTLYYNATPKDTRRHALDLANAIEKVAAQGGSGNFILSLDDDGKAIERMALGESVTTIEGN